MTVLSLMTRRAGETTALYGKALTIPHTGCFCVLKDDASESLLRDMSSKKLRPKIYQCLVIGGVAAPGGGQESYW
jgi:hypothetical protein